MPFFKKKANQQAKDDKTKDKNHEKDKTKYNQKEKTAKSEPKEKKLAKSNSKDKKKATGNSEFRKGAKTITPSESFDSSQIAPDKTEPRPRSESMIIRDVIEKHSSSLEEMMENHFRLFFNRLKLMDVSLVNSETAAPLNRMATRLRWLLKDDHKWVIQRRRDKNKRRGLRMRKRYNDYQYLASIKSQKTVPFPYPQPLPSWGINKPQREPGEKCWACGRTGDENTENEDEDESFNELEGAATVLEDKLELEDVFFKSMNLQSVEEGD